MSDKESHVTKCHLMIGVVNHTDDLPLKSPSMIYPPSNRPILSKISDTHIMLCFTKVFSAKDQQGRSIFSTRTRPEFKNELNENTVQFVRIRDQNVNFVLCRFQRFVLYLNSVLSFYFEIDIEQNLHFCPYFLQIVTFSCLM